MDHLGVEAGHRHDVAVGQRGEGHARVDDVPQHGVGRVEVDRPGNAGDELLHGVDVVVVRVSAHDADNTAASYSTEDGLRVMGGIDDEDLVVISDEPDVVVDLKILAVEAEDSAGDDSLDAGAHGANTTTLRSTSPWCILSNAASTSPTPIFSVTN